jgi:DNA helicase HerA-like ATPase
MSATRPSRRVKPPACPPERAAIVYGFGREARDLSMFKIGDLASLPHDHLLLDETRHAAIFGATRSGKSTMLANIAIQKIRAGGPLFIWDPHGTLIEELLWYIPRSRVADVVLVDPLDAEKQITLNPLQYANEAAALDLIEIMASVGGENSFMARSRDIATNFLLAAIHTLPDPTPFDLALMFRFEEYAKEIFARCPEAMYSDWGKKHFAKPQKQRDDIEAAPSNKANSLVTLTSLRHVFSQSAGGLDFDECIRTNKIVLFSLRKGQIGEEAANLLGSISLRMFLAATLRREPHTGAQAMALVDEAHSFSKLGNAIDLFLSESAKFNTAYILADQIFTQFSETTQKEIFANVSSLVALRVSALDAQVLGKELRMDEPDALVSLPTGEFWAKLVFPNLTRTPLHAFTPKWHRSDDRKKKFPQFLMKKRGDEARPEDVKRYSQEHNGTRRDIITARINERLEAAYAAERKAQ